MAIAVDARAAGAQGGGSTVTWSHTVAGSDRILLVAGSIVGQDAATLAVPTFGAASFTQYATVNCTTTGHGLGSGPMRVYLWYLLAPATGTDTITLTPTYGSVGYTMGSSISLTGVHQSATFNGAGPHTQNTNGVQPSVTVTSAADEWCVGCWSTISSPDPTPAAGAGQTTIGDLYKGANEYLQHLFTDEDASGSSTVLDYTGLRADVADGVGGIGASLMPAGGGGGPVIPVFMNLYRQQRAG